MYDLIVIGGGPAGLTATIYALRKRLNVLMISRDLGGKTNYHLSLPWIEDYQVIRGLEVVNKFKSEVEYLKFARQMDTVEHIERLPDGFEVQTKTGAKFTTRAVILATGTRQRRLSVPGEKEFMLAVRLEGTNVDLGKKLMAESGLPIISADNLADAADKVGKAVKGAK